MSEFEETGFDDRKFLASIRTKVFKTEEELVVVEAEKLLRETNEWE